MCVHDVLGDHKGASDSLKVELSMIVSLSVGAGNQIRVLWRKNSQNSLPPSHLSNCISFFWDKVYLCRPGWPGWPGKLYVHKAGFKLAELCPSLPPECWILLQFCGSQGSVWLSGKCLYLTGHPAGHRDHPLKPHYKLYCSLRWLGVTILIYPWEKWASQQKGRRPECEQPFCLTPFLFF